MSRSTAATTKKTQADTFVATGEMYKGLTREGVKAKTRDMGKTPFYPSWDADWCAWFVTNAARTADISPSIIPNLTNCDRTWHMNRGLYHKAKGWGGKYTPKRGDILYFDFNGDNYSDHTGIVRKYQNGRVSGQGSGDVPPLPLGRPVDIRVLVDDTVLRRPLS